MQNLDNPDVGKKGFHQELRNPLELGD
jgi:hypothetical protein